MYLFIWIVFGGVVGWIASMITGNNRRMGIILNVVVGLVGAAIGGFIGQAIGGASIEAFSLLGLILSLVGAVLLLMLVNYAVKNNK